MRKVYAWGAKDMLALKSTTGQAKGGSLNYNDQAFAKGWNRLGEGVECVDYYDNGSFPQTTYAKFGNFAIVQRKKRHAEYVYKPPTKVQRQNASYYDMQDKRLIKEADERKPLLDKNENSKNYEHI